MKTLKLFLIAAMLTIGMTSMPAQSKNKALKVTNITLAQAVQEPGLVAAMYEQLSLGSLKVDLNGNHTAIVHYNLNFYRISGQYRSWVRFFQSMPPVPVAKTIIHQ